MRIFLTWGHRYPGHRGGLPSGFVTDCLARGLAELGHEVFYWPQKGAAAPPPPGVTLLAGLAAVARIAPGVDVAHNAELPGKPWLLTRHADAGDRAAAGDNWIFPSRSLARTYGKTRFVVNGVDPSLLGYSGDKDDYLLFVGSFDYGLRKGWHLAVSLAEEAGRDLVVAGSGGSPEVRRRFAEASRSPRVRPVGDVRGREKAELFARARALLCPTLLNEGCPTVILEALISGTPVIASQNGACPELVDPQVGFVCRSRREYLEAIERAGEISPRACRDLALARFHYRRMARDYAREYEREIDLHRRGLTAPKGTSYTRLALPGREDTRIACGAPDPVLYNVPTR